MDCPISRRISKLMDQAGNSEPDAQSPFSESSIEQSVRGSTPEEFSYELKQRRENYTDEESVDNLRSKKPRIEASEPGNSSSDRRITVLEALPLTILRPGEDAVPFGRRCKQFWKVGDYEEDSASDREAFLVGSDLVRVHPKFLHSNATSHKWALGALAELLDNSLDEVCNGATYVHVDSTINQKDKTNMLIIEDNGGGMNPVRIRQCMSFGYSGKRKKANTIGQYGNGLKTSTMRLGADAIVFSRCRGLDGKNPTQSIAMLSSTYLRETRQEDTIVPLIDFEKAGNKWNKMIRTTVDDWNERLQTIVDWSPFFSKKDLLKQLDFLTEQGTRIVIYNLWEDDQEQLELDFDTDPYDIQLRGVNRDEKNIEMAKKYPNSRHFLTYRHSLRSYTSILYLRLPPNFKIILRGKDVKHHDITNDMMLADELTYKPQPNPGETHRQNMVTSVKLGFVKDAHHHIDVQGFNVYHKNRLIKPFWRVWNAAGSDGRGVIGVLEANFVEPAHDKQGFERTTVLSRLENRLIVYQKAYWSSNCHQIGYARRRNSKKPEIADKESTPPVRQKPSSHQDQKSNASARHISKVKKEKEYKNEPQVDHETTEVINRERNEATTFPSEEVAPKEDGFDIKARVLLEQKNENRGLQIRPDETGWVNLVAQLQKEKEVLQSQLNEANSENKELKKENIALIDIFQQDRGRRDQAEEALRKKLREASETIDDLINKVKLLEAAKPSTCLHTHTASKLGLHPHRLT